MPKVGSCGRPKNIFIFVKKYKSNQNIFTITDFFKVLGSLVNNNHFILTYTNFVHKQLYFSKKTHKNNQHFCFQIKFQN